MSAGAMFDIPFAGGTTDRADHMRGDPRAMAEAMAGDALLLCLDGLNPIVEGGRLAWDRLESAARGDVEVVFLGLREGRACFAPVPASGSLSPGSGRLWPAVAALSADELALYGAARSLVNWHARHRFCAACGYPTALAKGGWQRDCTGEACRAQHFPRVDPVTIMLVQHEDMLLLGRQPRFPAGSYSALAGFVEPGESIEEAVAREVLEEVGIRVRDVSYIVSQPWPFPSSLMIGCLAHADHSELTIDRTELEDARWFTRGEVAEAFAAAIRGERDREFSLPGHQAIAHHLIGWWLDRA
jgi:NAD+ diphosphatase